MFGLLGPNGAVKSTLAQFVTGRLEPMRGTIRLDGEDVVEEPDVETLMAARESAEAELSDTRDVGTQR